MLQKIHFSTSIFHICKTFIEKLSFFHMTLLIDSQFLIRVQNQLILRKKMLLLSDCNTFSRHVICYNSQYRYKKNSLYFLRIKFLYYLIASNFK